MLHRFACQTLNTVRGGVLGHGMRRQMVAPITATAATTTTPLSKASWKSQPGFGVRHLCDKNCNHDKKFYELEDLLENNEQWAKDVLEEDPSFFDKRNPQKPRYLFITCSDARIDPFAVTGLTIGDIFTHRNVGNVVANDLNLNAVLEFAVDTLKVPHIVVCGHYDCGAVRGSIARPDEGGLGSTIESWLRNIRDVARLHKDELMAIDDPEQRHRRLVEFNVIEQCLNIFKVGCVQRARLKNYVEGSSEYTLPRVHGIVYDPTNGKIKKLTLNFNEEIQKYREIYDLYHFPASDKRSKPADQK